MLVGHLWFSFCDRARVLTYILKNQLFALKYTLKHSLIKVNKINKKNYQSFLLLAYYRIPKEVDQSRVTDKCQDYLCSEDIQTSIRPRQTLQLETATSFLLISTYIISREEEYLRSRWSQTWTRYFPPCMIIGVSPSCSQKFRTRHEPRGGTWKTRHQRPPFRGFSEKVKKR